MTARTDRRRLLEGAAATLVLAGCRAPAPSTPERVKAQDHHAFFLWPGVAAPPWLRTAREVYLLAGEVRHQPDSRFTPLRATPAAVGPALWLVVRIERLDWQPAIHAEILRTLATWEAAGNRIRGLQIDFDAATRGLERYAEFLGGLRKSLPGRWALSITGLMDWSAGGTPQALQRLAGTVDEIVVQTYQGRSTIPGYEAYLQALQRLRMPYRIGLVQNGFWRPPVWLQRDPWFRGYVVFLLGR